MQNIYHNLPQMISPTALQVGLVTVQWYSLMWVMAFVSIYVLLVWRIKRGEYHLTIDALGDVIFYSIVGAMVGGRLGYVLFYDLSYYMQKPLAVISPYQFDTHMWTGIYGMSYHGGLLGVAMALWLWAHRRQHDFFALVDFIVPAVSLGYFFGRVGNFFNGELFGRVTDHFLGMQFGDGLLRHPSQLYEACGEGLFLFIVLWSLRRAKLPRGTLTALYIIGYASIRFILEYYRQPDAHLGFVVASFSLGQILSMIMFVGGSVLLWWIWHNKHMIKA